MKKQKLLIKLGLAIFIGITLGTMATSFGIEKSVPFTLFARSASTFTSLFSALLNFIIPLLILSFISTGLADLKKSASRLAILTLLLAYISTTIAGIGSFFISRSVLPNFMGSLSLLQTGDASYAPFFTIEIPALFGVMSALVLAFILGIGTTFIKGDTLLGVLKDLQNIVAMLLEKIIIPLIPIHIACLFLTLSSQGRFLSLAKTFATALALIVMLQILYLIFQYAAASVLCKKNQIPKLKNSIPAYITALGTQSSAATIPITLKCAYKNDINKDIADFCIPLCATIHLAGDTIAIVTSSIALLIASGQDVSFLTFLPFILMLGVTMVAAPGVPGGGVMSALALLESMLGFSTSLQQLMIALHFAQDSFGTATNVTGDLALAEVVNKYDRKTKTQ